MSYPFRQLAFGMLLLTTLLYSTVGQAQSVNSKSIPPDSLSTGKSSYSKDTAFNPLIIINGHLSTTLSRSQINPSSIEKVDVLKGESAVKQYGEKGKDGVILITLKASLRDTIPASFPGGLLAWRKYIEQNLHYPEAAYTKKTQGIVSVQMKVDEQGKITEVQSMNDPGNGLAEEAVRVVKAGPSWIAATVNGKPIPFDFRQKITFRIAVGADGNMLVQSIQNSNRYNQQVIIKTPRMYKGQPVQAISPAYERNGVNVQLSAGNSYFLSNQEALQAFGIVVSNEGYVVPEDAKVVYYDNNATEFDNWGSLKFVGGVPSFPLSNLFSTPKRKVDPSKLPIIVLNGKEASIEQLQTVYNNRMLRSTNLVKMQDAPALAKYGQQGQNGVLFASTKMSYPDNYLYLYEGKEITNEETPKPGSGTYMNYKVLVGKYAEQQYGEKAKFGAVIITTEESKPILPDTIFAKATQPATFPGGEEALKKYLAVNLRYPAAALKNKTEGTVQVQVILDTTGAVKRAIARQHPGDGLMEEAARLLQEGPAWIPARQNGRLVAYSILVPVVFKLDTASYY